MNDRKLGNLIKECRDEMLSYNIDESEYKLLNVARNDSLWSVEFENDGGMLVLFHEVCVDDEFHIMQCRMMLR